MSSHSLVQIIDGFGIALPCVARKGTYDVMRIEWLFGQIELVIRSLWSVTALN
jgi:hypothetical protein